MCEQNVYTVFCIQTAYNLHTNCIQKQKSDSKKKVPQKIFGPTSPQDLIKCKCVDSTVAAALNKKHYTVTKLNYIF